MKTFLTSVASIVLITFSTQAQDISEKLQKTNNENITSLNYRILPHDFFSNTAQEDEINNELNLESNSTITIKTPNHYEWVTKINDEFDWYSDRDGDRGVRIHI